MFSWQLLHFWSRSRKLGDGCRSELETAAKDRNASCLQENVFRDQPLQLSSQSHPELLSRDEPRKNKTWFHNLLKIINSVQIIFAMPYRACCSSRAAGCLHPTALTASLPPSLLSGVRASQVPMTLFPQLVWRVWTLSSCSSICILPEV